MSDAVTPANGEAIKPADLLIGAPAIAAFLGKPLKTTEYMLRKNMIPAFRIGTKWHLRPATYVDWAGSTDFFVGLEGGSR